MSENQRQGVRRTCSRFKPLRFEQLEGRAMMSVVAEVEPNNEFFSQYQPLNGDTSYVIHGSIANASDQDWYGFYLADGATSTATTTYSNGQTVSASQVGTGSVTGWGLRPQSGFTYPIGPYTMTITGTSKPFIQVVSPAGTTDFRISEVPEMPQITVRLAGLAPGPTSSYDVHWTTDLGSKAGDFPHQVAAFKLPTIKATVNNSFEYAPNFGGKIMGGNLDITATANFLGQSFVASTENSDNTKNLRIVGTQPDQSAISSYINSKASVAPAEFPAGYSYGDVLTAILQQETRGRQFDANGQPIFNTTNDGGAGLFQITPPSSDHVWNWKANVDAGIRVFNTKLKEAAGWIDGRQVARAAESVRINNGLPPRTQVRVQTPPWTRNEMVIREAVQRYNGGNAFIATGSVEVLPDGSLGIVVTWQRTASTYHEIILGPLTTIMPILL